MKSTPLHPIDTKPTRGLIRLSMRLCRRAGHALDYIDIAASMKLPWSQEKRRCLCGKESAVVEHEAVEAGGPAA